MKEKMNYIIMEHNTNKSCTLLRAEDSSPVAKLIRTVQSYMATTFLNQGCGGGSGIVYY
jgi:hypothetical protein